LFKLKSVYAQGLQKEIKLKTGTIHTNYSQIAVSTGRLSSQEPNLQNIPIVNDYGMAIRKSFKPRPGHVFISADYSQIELRVLAYLSQDQALIKAFINEQDIHIETAARLFGTTLTEVKPEQRQIGKKINFSILYGLTAYGLSKDLSIPVKEAANYIEAYFQQFPGVKNWMDDVTAEVQKTGYVLTVGGRRRYFPEIFEKNKTMFEMAKRSAINTVAQGTAAEIVKLGMINLSGKIKELNISAQILLQIHDELLIEVSESQAVQMQNVLKEVLESVVNWPIPLRVSIAQGLDWAEVS
jgi:DNA polymerase-1